MFHGYALKTYRDLELKRNGWKAEEARKKTDFKINQKHIMENNL
jgi:hypothetical protein